MSLETALQEATAAIRTLTEVLTRNHSSPVPVPEPPTPQAAPAPVSSSEAPVLVPVSSSEAPVLVPVSLNETSAPKAAPTQSTVRADVTYKELRALGLRVAAEKGRECFLAFIARFGIQRLSDASEAQRPALADMARQVLEEDYDPRECQEEAAAA